jgi:hypothetical protein
MKGQHPDIEQSLRALKWRAPEEGALERSLQPALAARASMQAKRPSFSRPGTVLHFIPRVLRLPLAACWAASLAFWALTPRENPSPLLAANNIPPGMDSFSLLAKRDAVQQQTHELLLALENHDRRW